MRPVPGNPKRAGELLAVSHSNVRAFSLANLDVVAETADVTIGTCVTPTQLGNDELDRKRRVQLTPEGPTDADDVEAPERSKRRGPRRPGDVHSRALGRAISSTDKITMERWTRWVYQGCRRRRLDS